jgi:pyruvate/2-oxoglutarate dehydrogenase complex dihydrolipoamide acyltransferase (E2) component
VPIQSIRIPQMGEGLQEALLVEFLKQPGDEVQRDDAIYVMETDKATTEIESPFAGRLLEWTVEAGSVLPIGTEVARIEVAETTSQEHETASKAPPLTPQTPLASQASPTPQTEVFIPPRTRKYLKEKGLLDQAHAIPCRGNKLTQEDVDRYLMALAPQGSLATQDNQIPALSKSEFDERPVPKQQVALNYRLVRSVQTTVPVSVMIEVDWTAIASARQQIKASGGKETGFYLMLWCVAQALARHPGFRTSISSDGTVFRTYRHVHFGIAVALPEDTLLTAAVHHADGMTREEFFQAVTERIELARQGTDQADPSVTVSVSNIGTASMRSGIPAIASPAVATLALGEVFDAPVPYGEGFRFQKRAQLTLAFDHRILNGVGAAAFMNDIKEQIESFSL